MENDSIYGRCDDTRDADMDGVDVGDNAHEDVPIQQAPPLPTESPDPSLSALHHAGGDTSIADLSEGTVDSEGFGRVSGFCFESGVQDMCTMCMQFTAVSFICMHFLAYSLNANLPTAKAFHVYEHTVIRLLCSSSMIFSLLAVTTSATASKGLYGAVQRLFGSVW